MKATQELNLISQYNMISLIAAVAKNYCIGKDNKLPWHIPEDLQHFKDITSKKTVLMGRKTYESIVSYLGKPLPKRTNIVITSNKDYVVPDEVEVYTNIEEAFSNHKDEEVFVIGGAYMYEQTIRMANKLYITWVDKEVDGDSFFPEIRDDLWREISREKHDSFSFVEYIKK